MATVSIQYMCGCGTKCLTVEAAAAHCTNTGHTMTVSGQVKPDQKLVKIQSASELTEAGQPAVFAATGSDRDSFSAMKAKLHRKE